MKKIIIIVLIVLVAYFIIKDGKKEVAAPVTPPTAEVPTDGNDQTPDSPLPSSDSVKSSQAATAALAAELKVAASSITVVSALAMDWSDGCLGLGGPAEICAAVITPGYKVTLSANSKSYVYRTDATGSVVRKEK